jgi:urease accessory protein
MLELIRQPCPTSDEALPQIAVSIDRVTLAKRRWRGVADDGREFGFTLDAPLKHGDCVFQSEAARYTIQQQPEPLLEISLEIAPSAAAGIGWAIGNLHLELSAEASRLLAPDEPAVRQLLTRLGVLFQPTSGIFRPGRFARGQHLTHELGPSHRH